MGGNPARLFLKRNTNTGQLYQMTNNKTTSFNHQVYQKAYKRLNLTSTQRFIFQRLLGFLIRNDKSFPFSAVKMAELTGFSLRTIFTTLNHLEKLRLIKRSGLGKNRRFSRGTILDKIFTTVQNRTKDKLSNSLTTVQLVQQNLCNRAADAYKKTSLSSKPKDTSHFFVPLYQEYSTRISADIKLGLIPRETTILTPQEWLQIHHEGASIMK